MDKSRTEKSKGKINNKFQQLANDFGFELSRALEEDRILKRKLRSL